MRRRGHDMTRHSEAVSEKLEGTAEKKEKLRLWLRLLTCTTRIENIISNRLREEFDTTLPRFDVMAALYRVEDTLTMGELSKWLLVSNGNVTGVVDRLVKDRLVERKAAVRDRRVQNIRLTLRGRRRFKLMAAAHEGWINQMLGSLSPSDIQDLMTKLRKIKGALS